MKPGRNDPCPCGSGRKYKKCCEANGGPQRGPDVGRLFAQAERECERGQLDQAEKVCEQILALNPQHAGALHLRGALALQAGRHHEAAESIGKAILMEPGVAVYHSNLGVALERLGLKEEALAACREAVRLSPNSLDGLCNLGGILCDLGRPGEALPHLRKAVALNPSHSLSHTNLALALHASGASDEALVHARKAVELAPRSVVAIKKCAEILAEMRHWAEAEAYFARWAEFEPNNAATYVGIGDCYAKQGLHSQAAAHYSKALELKPDCGEAANNLAVCLAEEGERAAAMALCRQAVECKPDDAAGWMNLGVAMKSLGELELALRCFNFAAALGPPDAHTLWNRSLCYLSLGRIADGWEEYEWGWESGARSSRRPFSFPVWDGTDPAGKTILVSMEQGLGDHIVFSSMIPDLVRAGAHCIVECEPRLVTLFARSFPGVEVVPLTLPPQPRTQEPDIDLHTYAASLARWLRPSLEAFPQGRGHIAPDAERIACWRKRVSALGDGLKVGICWRSMMHTRARSLHYAELDQWGPILTTPGAHFVNLQYDQCEEELREAERRFGVRIHTWDDVDLRNDQESVAALISSLDLVISALTAVAQMGGGVGAPTWVLNRGTTDWWELGTDRCPWYTSVRVFSCGVNDPWEPVIDRVASELQAAVGGINPADRGC